MEEEQKSVSTANIADTFTVELKLRRHSYLIQTMTCGFSFIALSSWGICVIIIPLGLQDVVVGTERLDKTCN